MGNCSQCLRESVPVKQKSSAHTSNYSTMLDDNTLPRYTKLVVDQVNQDGLEDFNNIQNIDKDTLLNFTVHIYNMRLTSFQLKEEFYLQGDIDEDSQKRKKETYKRNKNLESIQQTTSTNQQQTLDDTAKPRIIEFDLLEASGIRWKTMPFRVDNEGSRDIDMDNHFRYECTFNDIWSKCFIIEFYNQKYTLKPFAYVVVDFLALAIGPKSCDLEVRDYKTRRFLGRIAFDISIKQLQQIELQLFDLKAKINHKEEKALYGQFKFITTTDGPKISKPTYSQIGRFKKEKNHTRFTWLMNEDQDDIPSVKQISSLESLKNSTLQLVLKVDRSFSDAMHRQVVQKISMVERYKLIKGEQNDRKLPQINIEGVEDQSVNITKNNDIDFEQLISRDSSKSKSIGLLTGAQQRKIKHNISFLHSTNFCKHQSQVIEDINERKLTDMDLLELYGSPQFQTKLSGNKDPLDLLSQIEIVKRSKSIIQKRERKTIVIDAAEYYSKYNEVGDNSISLIASFIGECYIGFTKLLQSEFRQFDRRDSSILQNKLNSSIKVGNQDSISIRDNKLDTEEDEDQKFTLQQQRQKANKIDRKYFSEQIWAMGKVIGTLSGTFKVKNLPLIQQMALGILTESGIIMNQAPILVEEKDGLTLGMLRRKQRNERITQLIELTKKLKKVDNLKGKKQIYQTYNEKEKILNDLITILCESDKTIQGHMYKYVDDFDLIRAQQALIELAFHCLLLVESVRYEFKRDYYEIISQILMRDELKLPNVTLKGTNVTNQFKPENKQLNRLLDDPTYDKSVQYKARDNSLNINNGRVTPSTRMPLLAQNRQFKSNQEQSIKSNMTERYDEDTKERIRQEKMKIAIFYQKLLFQTLDDCLNKFCRKDVEPYLKSYLEICISLAFFRVPRFQRLFIDCISDHTEMYIPEWKGVSWNIEDEMDLDIEAGMATLYDWDSNFHKMIPKSQETFESQQILVRIENNKRWQARIKKRSIAMFHIIKRWTNILNNKAQSQSPFWQDIPGYCIILKQMLVQLKERNVSDYADSLIDSISSFLPNTQLLTVFINIIFGKTNAFDAKTLCITMDIATKWINYVEQNGFEFPSNFDFQFFFKGIQVALDMDHSLSTPRTLYLIYRILHFLPLDQRSKLINMLLQKYFYQLMFSWSYTIRDLFVSLMLYQIEFFFINKFSYNLYSSKLTQTPSDAINQQLNGSTKFDVALENLKNQRKEQFKQMDTQMKLYETFLQDSPNEAQLIFEHQFQTRRQRLVSDNETFIHKKQIFDQTQQTTKMEKVTSTDSHSVTNEEKSQLKGTNKDSTINAFMKAHSSFRQRISELEIIDEYFVSKNKEKGILSKQNSSQHDASPSMMEQQSTEIKSFDLEANYQKIVQNVPSHLKVYISSAIEEYYRQIQECEVWKTGQVSFYSDALTVLPEFNMEKNMPVEDDENLDRQEEW
eukprot:403333864